MRFDNWKRPPLDTAVSEIEVEGVRLDLHDKLRLVGLTFGLEPMTATLGWAATSPLLVVRQGRALPVSGLALHGIDLNRFEVAFEAEPPGLLEYFEFRQKDKSLLFFFEGGTIRLGCAVCRAELVVEGEAETEAASPGLVQ